MNIPTIIGVVVVSVIFIAIIVAGIINKKKGKTSCSCGCSACGMKDSCHPEK